MQLDAQSTVGGEILTSGKRPFTQLTKLSATPTLILFLQPIRFSTLFYRCGDGDL